jgi:hypothetical protein
MNPHNFHALIDEAYVYGFALFEIARTRYLDMHQPDAALRISPNKVWHDRRLCDDTSRWITTPNNDTLYSRAWLDLSQGPVRVSVDAMPPGRYWSVAFLDAMSNNFAMIGQRLDGIGPVSVTLIGPHYSGDLPTGRIIRAPGHDVWLLGRWIVDGPTDLANAEKMQDGLRVEALGVPANAVNELLALDHLDPEAFLAVVNAGLSRNPAPEADADLLERCTVIGLQPGNANAWQGLSPEIRAAWQAQIGPSYDAMRRAIPNSSRRVQGWRVRGPDLGNFGTNYAERSAIALGGLGALEPIEAVYASRAADDANGRLHGANHTILTIQPGSLPADGFWSLSMYEQTRDGRLFFTSNTLKRYTIGDRTRGLHYDADGALRIALGHAPPSDPNLLANWLPAPDGPYVITLRVYLPHEALREWRVPLPSVVTG